MLVHGPAKPTRHTLATPGVWVLLALTALGMGVAGYRLVFGLQAVTNLDQQHPWGLWIAIDVGTGVALAAGGFTTAALVHVFHRQRYSALIRPALLTAMLGYTFVGLGLMFDLGRYYNIWHPILPSMWQGNSVLFEVGLCVMCYLTVLYIEFLPIVCERFIGDDRYPKLGRVCEWVKRVVHKTMFMFILAGVVLSCLHQSSLGTLMVIAPSKVHPLWYTPILPLLFLLSAIAVGFPMVIFESIYASWSMRTKYEMHLLAPLARFIPVFLGIYLAFKIGDMVVRESYRHFTATSVTGMLFALEIILGLVVPLALLLSARVRNSPRWLFIASLMVVLGVALNRVNVFLVSYQPPYAVRSYFPSVGEFAVTIGLIAGLMLVYRIVVTYLPVLSSAKKAGMA